MLISRTYDLITKFLFYRFIFFIIIFQCMCMLHLFCHYILETRNLIKLFPKFSRKKVYLFLKSEKFVLPKIT